MGADNFSSSATVEKSGENYYMTFGHSSSVDDLVLESGNMQTGYTVRTESGWTYYTYTMSAERLQGSLSFTAYIVPMSMTVEFSITLNLAAGTRTGKGLDENRPEKFTFYEIYAAIMDGLKDDEAGRMIKIGNSCIGGRGVCSCASVSTGSFTIC